LTGHGIMAESVMLDKAKDFAVERMIMDVL